MGMLYLIKPRITEMESLLHTTREESQYNYRHISKLRVPQSVLTKVYYSNTARKMVLIPVDKR